MAFASAEHEASVLNSQSIFTAGVASGRVKPARKRHYPVRVERVVAGTLVPTKENRSPGQTAGPGQWLVQLVDPGDLTTVLNAKDGLPNQWLVKEAKLVSTYVVGQDVLAAGVGVVWTNTDGPPVYMMEVSDVDLPEKKIVTGWGPAGFDEDTAWLANYDYNPDTGVAGEDFNIVDVLTCAQNYVF
jgi:hypothetical protein